MNAFPLPYVILVSDGVSMRSVHPAALGEHRPAIEAALRAICLGVKPDVVSPKPAAPALGARPPKPPPPQTTATMTQGEIARVSGYTGDACSNCGEFRMKRSGTCLTCEACGSTSGGCS